MNFNLTEFETGQYAVVTRSGLKAVDVGIGRNRSTIIQDNDGNWFLENHNMNGFVNKDETEHDNDLLMYKLETQQ